MKRKRARVVLRIPEKCSTAQLCLLIGGHGFGKPYPYYGVFGPFWIDVSSNRLLPWRESSIEVASFHEGTAPRYKDRPLHHSRASGILSMLMNYHIEQFDEVVPSANFDGGELNARGQELFYTKDDQVIQGAEIYEYGTDILAGTISRVIFSDGFQAVDSDPAYPIRLIESGSGDLYTEIDLYYHITGTFSFYIPPRMRVSHSDGIIPYWYASVKRDAQVNEEGHDPVDYTNQTVEMRILAISPIMSLDASGTNSKLKSVAKISRSTLLCLNRLEASEPIFWSAKKAVDGFNDIDVNSLANLKEIKDTLSVVKPFLELVRNIKKPKAWAQFRLWLLYGVKPTIGDVRAMIDAIIHFRKTAKTWDEYLKFKRAFHSRYGTEFLDVKDLPQVEDFSIRCNSRVVARPVLSSLQWEVSLSTFLNLLGFRITGENLWDMLPYSFVIDWFVNIGRLIEQMDYREISVKNLLLREWLYSTHVVTHNRPRLFKHLDLSGQLKFEVYDRSVSKTLPNPPWTIGSPNFLQHWWEGALLLLSNKK